MVLLMKTLQDVKPRHVSWFAKLSFLLPRPLTGSFLLDGLYLVQLLLLQDFLLPLLNVSFLGVDLITPWLSLAFVFYDWARASFLVLVAGLLLETHSSVPPGLYLTSYWMIFAAVHLIRRQISWVNSTPWMTYIVVSILLLNTMEGLCVLAYDHVRIGEDLFLNLGYWSRIAWSCIFGWCLVLGSGQRRFES